MVHLIEELSTKFELDEQTFDFFETFKTIKEGRLLNKVQEEHNWCYLMTWEENGYKIEIALSLFQVVCRPDQLQ